MSKADEIVLVLTESKNFQEQTLNEKDYLIIRSTEKKDIYWLVADFFGEDIEGKDGSLQPKSDHEKWQEYEQLKIQFKGPLGQATKDVVDRWFSNSRIVRVRKADLMKLHGPIENPPHP